ncbi:MAG: hypothetical protein HOF97_03105 [Candidatus Marinimicrobia bacterium]|nr:hypothetical protein [Candidatus Neomarinimicrobiota bacterium]
MAFFNCSSLTVLDVSEFGSI